MMRATVVNCGLVGTTIPSLVFKGLCASAVTPIYNPPIPGRGPAVQNVARLIIDCFWGQLVCVGDFVSVWRRRDISKQAPGPNGTRRSTCDNASFERVREPSV